MTKSGINLAPLLLFFTLILNEIYVRVIKYRLS